MYKNIVIPCKRQGNSGNFQEQLKDHILINVNKEAIVPDESGYMFVNCDTLSGKYNFWFVRSPYEKAQSKSNGEFLNELLMCKFFDNEEWKEKLNNIVKETMKNFYGLTKKTKGIENSYKYLLRLLEDSQQIEFNDDISKEINKSYITKSGEFRGDLEIELSKTGIGHTIREIVKEYKEKFPKYEITEKVYKCFLCLEGVELNSRITGVKTNEAYASANGSSIGYHGRKTYLYKYDLSGDLGKLIYAKYVYEDKLDEFEAYRNICIMKDQKE